MKTKRFFTIAEIANMMKMLDIINTHEKEWMEIFKDDPKMIEIEHRNCEEDRKKCVWIFDIFEIDVLFKAKNYYKGDKTINGNEKMWIN